MMRPHPIKALPTAYRGVEMRSRLEARVAEKFDRLGIEWVYEVEGLDLGGGVWYLPDFWLPTLHTFVEAKGVADPIGALRKPHHLSAAFCGYEWDFEPTRPAVVIVYDAWTREPDITDRSKGFSVLAGGRCVDESWFCQCAVCGNWWFLSADGHYTCRACGHHDGNGHLAECVIGEPCPKCRGER